MCIYFKRSSSWNHRTSFLLCAWFPVRLASKIALVFKWWFSPERFLFSLWSSSQGQTNPSILMSFPECPAGKHCGWSAWRSKAVHCQGSCRRGCWVREFSQSRVAAPWSWSWARCWTSCAWRSRRHHWGTGWGSASGRPQSLSQTCWCLPGSALAPHTA